MTSLYNYPGIDLLSNHESDNIVITEEEIEENKIKILQTLSNYKIYAVKITATIGTSITLYEITPAPNIRISKIKNLEDDIAFSLAALGIRIIAPIPGKGTVGIEVPNSTQNTVSMKALVESDKFQNTEMELPIALGKTIPNEEFIVDLTKMPHLIIAGAAGQGKSHGVNTIITSLLYKKHPSQLKFVMIDKSILELSIYKKLEKYFSAKLPNTETLILSDTKKVINTLNALVVEMENRLTLCERANARNIIEYNTKFTQNKLNQNNGHKFLPYIVVIINEFANYIKDASEEIETPIASLAQKARAIGIHLIIATEHPSANILTGIIKANFLARIAFRVASRIDSRVILDAAGASQLIGRGDMLYSGWQNLTRIQCAFIKTKEVESIVDFVAEQHVNSEPYYLPDNE
jgi:DNA segregation ATPase FtsK/SpoIIIE, S-DNA-T family